MFVDVNDIAGKSVSFAVNGDSDYSYYTVKTLYVFPMSMPAQLRFYARHSFDNGQYQICITKHIDLDMQANFKNPAKINMDLPLLNKTHKGIIRSMDCSSIDLSLLDPPALP